MRTWQAIRGLVSTVVLLLASALVVAPANASNFGSTACAGSPRNCVSRANNIYHAVAWEGDRDITPGMDIATFWAVDNVYNPTDLVAYRDESDPYPDVRVWDYPYGDNGVLAWVECPPDNTGTGGTDPNRWCRGQKLRYNSHYWWNSTEYDTEDGRRRIACHELGHTVGLRHLSTTDSCMYQYAGSGGISSLGTHSISHINNNY